MFCNISGIRYCFSPFTREVGELSFFLFLRQKIWLMPIYTALQYLLRCFCLLTFRRFIILFLYFLKFLHSLFFLGLFFFLDHCLVKFFSNNDKFLYPSFPQSFNLIFLLSFRFFDCLSRAE